MQLMRQHQHGKFELPVPWRPVTVQGFPAACQIGGTAMNADNAHTVIVVPNLAKRHVLTHNEMRRACSTEAVQLQALAEKWVLVPICAQRFG